MLTSVFVLLAAAAVIYFSCEAFVNGVEWLGRRLSIGRTATGTILAAFGTALPESVVTLVATAFGDHPADRQIGIGAALGGPLALSTIAYAIVGLALLAKARKGGGKDIVNADGRRLSRDQGWFLAIFSVKIGLGLLAFACKPWLGCLFLAAYVCYLRTELTAVEEDDGEDLAPLLLRRDDAQPTMVWILVQTLSATAAVFLASRVFVDQLAVLSPLLGLGPQVTALLLSPVATELPETVNALIWVRQGKERLALANISGAMMIQATIPTAFGLFFTPWLLDRTLLAAAAMTAAAILLLFRLFRQGPVKGAVLARVGWLYGLFIALAWGLG
jgi:cation:H+ antiporter